MSCLFRAKCQPAHLGQLTLPPVSTHVQAKLFQKHSELDFRISLSATSNRQWRDPSWVCGSTLTAELAADKPGICPTVAIRVGAVYLRRCNLPCSNAAGIFPRPLLSLASFLSIYCYLMWASKVSGVNIPPSLLNPFLHDLTNLWSSGQERYI